MSTSILLAGLLVRAMAAAAQARLAERGEWVRNEEGIVARAGLTDIEPVLADLGAEPAALLAAIERLRATPELGRSTGHQPDVVVRGASR